MTDDPHRHHRLSLRSLEYGTSWDFDNSGDAAVVNGTQDTGYLLAPPQQEAAHDGAPPAMTPPATAVSFVSFAPSPPEQAVTGGTAVEGQGFAGDDMVQSILRSASARKRAVPSGSLDAVIPRSLGFGQATQADPSAMPVEEPQFDEHGNPIGACGNLDIVVDQFPRGSQLRPSPHALCAAFSLGPTLVGG